MPIDESLPFHPVNIAVLTVSDTRDLASDRSGQTPQERNEAARQHGRLQGCLGRHPGLPTRCAAPPLQPGGADAAAEGAPERGVSPPHHPSGGGTVPGRGSIGSSRSTPVIRSNTAAATSAASS